MTDKGKKQVEDSSQNKLTPCWRTSGSCESVFVKHRFAGENQPKIKGCCLCRDIPKMNPEDLEGQDNPTVKVFNTFREHLLEIDCSHHAMVQGNRKQLKLLTDAISGQGRLVNLMWSEHCELQKAFQEEKELTRKAILYSIERSGGYALPDSQPTIREELLRSFGAKSKAPEGSTPNVTGAAKRQRRLDFDNADAGDGTEGANAGEGGKEKTDEVDGIKYGYIGSAHFPRRLKVSFWPPPGMQFLIFEIACGAYGFSKSKDKTQCGLCDPRNQYPLTYATSTILDVVATMLTDQLTDSIWWLPTAFGPIALNPAGYCKDTLDFIVRRYMGYVDETHKIYVPLSCEGHWFLLVVDLRDSKVIYLDSLKDVNAGPARRQIIDFVSNYDPEIMNSTHRYRLATSLMMAKSNVKRDEVGLTALSYYEGRDGTRKKELDISSDSASSCQGNVPVNVDSDSVEI
ncbi:hypothetical protein PIB30_047644 [Stylosanthes scabra]|uniref:Ubiquitin-like protease family profile domain-containing protein n=1 Tax=Stylosanthes scabra TaxID=79078 RepID=A0ABU6UFH7_9FABA|nr:hypothetical protein [Stylosanthes scabra]